MYPALICTGRAPAPPDDGDKRGPWTLTWVMGDSEGDMVGDSCLASPRRCSAPGDSVRGLMGAGRRRGELLSPAGGGGLGSAAIRSDEWMDGLLRDMCIWEVLREAWMDGLLRDEDRPAPEREGGEHKRG